MAKKKGHLKAPILYRNKHQLVRADKDLYEEGYSIKSINSMRTANYILGRIDRMKNNKSMTITPGQLKALNDNVGLMKVRQKGKPRKPKKGAYRLFPGVYITKVKNRNAYRVKKS